MGYETQLLKQFLKQLVVGWVVAFLSHCSCLSFLTGLCERKTHHRRPPAHDPVPPLQEG